MKLFDSLLTKVISYSGNQYYPIIVGLQILVVMEALLLERVLELFSMANAAGIRDFIFLLTGSTYMFFNWSLFSGLIQKPRAAYLVLLTLILSLGATVLILNPLFPMVVTDQARQPYLLAIHLTLFMVEITFIFVCIQDVFSRGMANINKLWGAACIYLMIGISFGSLYDLICIWKPGSLGQYFQLGLASYTQCIAYSVTVISGLDAIHKATEPLVDYIAILEAIWSNLFVMILVGRLMSLPWPKSEE